ncbi:hypothetical protein [Pseudomarimonas arenosa]|uniref:Uncharacterized protein n=1 Tax=Pseudomarimonas arenosa TaxID=2774145 RepID=A0AAW3ZM12_9GAMM|nr:hypothetical protein [Pseudomarimonas arenosa]MBD8526209.1 hypothetical protein [Pseudomarimonas arenosa]
MEGLLVSLIVLAALTSLGRHAWRWLQPLLHTAPATGSMGSVACTGCPQRATCSSSSRSIPVRVQDR